MVVASQGAHPGPRRAERGAAGHLAVQDKESVMGLGKKAKDKAKIIKGRTKKHAGKATGKR